VIRVAAVGDLHYDRQSRGRLASHFASLAGLADILLIAGDLTQSGAPEEASALAEDLRDLAVPVVAVLGNHDFHLGREAEILAILQSVGVIALEGATATFDLAGYTVGVMGLKGFGGGFAGACVTEFGEEQTKAFARHAKQQAEVLRNGLMSLNTDYRFALLHFSPVEETLLGERREIYPFLGSYLLAEALDAAHADGAFHGHAHMGSERGTTPGGVPVRNVAQMVIRHAYKVYSFEAPAESERKGRWD
jgi:Icc-related predicted phosphoesterase